MFLQTPPPGYSPRVNFPTPTAGTQQAVHAVKWVAYDERQLLSSAPQPSVPLHLLILPAHFALPDREITSTQVHIHSVLSEQFQGHTHRRRYPEK